jgi:hypothetical protein
MRAICAGAGQRRNHAHCCVGLLSGMDYVGTVAFFDGAKRLLGMPWLQRHVEVSMIQDGATASGSSMNRALEEPLVPGDQILDWYRLDERLTKCLDERRART